MGDNIIQGMFVKLGYDFDESQLTRFNQGVERTRRFLKQAALAAIGLAAALSVVAVKFARQAIQTDRTAKAINAETKSLEGLLRVSDKILGSRESGLSVVQKISDAQRNIKAFGGEGLSKGFLRGLDKVGVSIEDVRNLDPTETLLRISEGLQGLGKDGKDIALTLLGMTQQTELLTRAGLRQEVVAASTDKVFEALREADAIVKQLGQDFEDFLFSFSLGDQKDPFFIVALRWLRDTGIPIIEEFTDKLNFGFNKLKGLVESVAVEFAKVTSLIKGLEKKEDVGVFAKILSGIYNAAEQTGSNFGSAIDIFNAVRNGVRNGDGDTSNSNTNNISQSINISGIQGAADVAGVVGAQGKVGIQQALNGTKNGIVN